MTYKRLKIGGEHRSTPLQRSVFKSPVMRSQAYPDGGEAQGMYNALHPLENPGTLQQSEDYWKYKTGYYNHPNHPASGAVYDPTDKWAMDAIMYTMPIGAAGSILKTGENAFLRNASRRIGKEAIENIPQETNTFDKEWLDKMNSYKKPEYPNTYNKWLHQPDEYIPYGADPAMIHYINGGVLAHDEEYKKGGWIQGAIKHPGRCTPGSPNYDCPKGSPQWNLAQRFKHGDLHKKDQGGPSPAKAREMLHDKTAHGHPLTDQQRKYFGWLSHQKTGGMHNPNAKEESNLFHHKEYYNAGVQQVGGQLPQAIQGGLGRIKHHRSYYEHPYVQQHGIPTESINLPRDIERIHEEQPQLPIQAYGGMGGLGDHLTSYPMVMNLGGINNTAIGYNMNHGGIPCKECGGTHDTGGQFPKDIPAKKQSEFLQWLRDTSMDALHEEFTNNPLGLEEEQEHMKKGGSWIQGAVKKSHKGYCTPMTKSTCTPRRKALAMTFKKHHGFHQEGGQTDYQNGYTYGTGFLAKEGGDVHDKPGGSNVGKYKGVHSFAGPSGGAPSGSYPINTRKRAKAALSYAHYAPNPTGIRRAVHNKYPDLGGKQYGGDISIPDLPQAQYGWEVPFSTQPYHPWWDYVPNTAQQSYTGTIPSSVDQRTIATGFNQTPGGFNIGYRQDPNRPLDPYLNQPGELIGGIPAPGSISSQMNTQSPYLAPGVGQPQPTNQISFQKNRNWKDRWWAQPDIINAGMEGATNIINNLPGGALDRQRKWLRGTTSADWWNALGRGNRGDYSPNNGYFRPQSQVPVQFAGQSGNYSYAKGGEYYLDEKEAQRLRDLGYDIVETE